MSARSLERAMPSSLSGSTLAARTSPGRVAPDHSDLSRPMSDGAPISGRVIWPATGAVGLSQVRAIAPPRPERCGSIPVATSPQEIALGRFGDAGHGVAVGASAR
jgi:hypothetical protein